MNYELGYEDNTSLVLYLPNIILHAFVPLIMCLQEVFGVDRKYIKYFLYFKNYNKIMLKKYLNL